MQINKPQKSNYKDLSKLAQELILTSPYFSILAKKEYVKDFTVKELAKKIEEQDQIYFVAKKKNRVIGFIQGYFDGTGMFWLGWIGVDKNYQGQGIGDKLVKFLINYLKKSKKIHKIITVIRPQNITSQKLFAKNEFKKFAYLKKHWYKQDYQFWELFL